MSTFKKKGRADLALFKTIAMLSIVCIPSVLIIILSLNLDIFCIPKNNRALNISNEEIFFISSLIFVAINIFLLKYSLNLESTASKKRSILFLVIVISQLTITACLFTIYEEIKTSSLYYTAIFYILISVALISSAFYLTIAGVQFLRWFAHLKNYLVLIYGLVMLVLLVNSLFALSYLLLDSLSHRYLIKRTSCSVMISSLNNPNSEYTNFLTYAYDTTSFLSFVLAWAATVAMLKEYSKRKNKFAYWIIVILPLIFFLSRYEIALYYISSNKAVDILSSIDLSSSIYGYDTLEKIINANLQFGGLFFGVAFFVTAVKLPSGGQQRAAMIITGIGIMLLFGSKDISTLIIASYPPLGSLSIAFTGLACYLVYTGIYNAAKLTVRDKKLRRGLREKVENNLLLLRSIATSQDHLDTEKNVRHLMKISTELQAENEQQDMTQEEIREVVKDVISELRSSQKKVP